MTTTGIRQLLAVIAGVLALLALTPFAFSGILPIGLFLAAIAILIL
jgi:hypothetical protein